MPVPRVRATPPARTPGTQVQSEHPLQTSRALAGPGLRSHWGLPVEHPNAHQHWT